MSSILFADDWIDGVSMEGIDAVFLLLLGYAYDDLMWNFYGGGMV